MNTPTIYRERPDGAGVTPAPRPLIFRLTTGLLALFLCAVALQAADLRLLWNANSPADMVTQYSVWESTVLASVGTNTFARIQTVGTNTTATVTNVSGVRRYYVTARNALGESGPSNVITNALPSAPTGLHGEIVIRF